MKTLINNIKKFLEAAITKDDVSAKIVMKGFEKDPDQVPVERYPFIMVDDGGERVEEINSNTQDRIYSVIVDFGVIVYDVPKAMDNLLDLSDQIKTQFELEANRQLDGHTWGVTINPFEGKHKTNKFFRGRTVIIDFHELEDRAYNPY